jgi:hypothetical protein
MSSRTAETLLWAQYPDGRYGAVVQSDGQAIYFAIQKLHDGEPTESPSRWVWVRNLRPAPLMAADPAQDPGRLPLVAEAYCLSPQGGPTLDPEHTQVLWFEQGIGAMLIENRLLVALLPPQPKLDLPGFSADCRQVCSVASPLADDDLYAHQAESLAEYWADWAATTPAALWQETLLPHLQHGFGPPVQEFRASGSPWPTLRIAQCGSALVTVGAALRHQPLVERELLNFTDHQRLELAVRLPDAVTPAQTLATAEWLAGLARYPWHHETCFLPLQTIATAPPTHPDATSVTIVSERQMAQREQRSALELPAYRHQAVNLLWLSPTGE